MKHDSCRSTSAYPLAGQNLYIFSTTARSVNVTQSLIGAVTSWTNEYKLANRSDVNVCCARMKFSKIGHFLQAVQDQSVSIGCGVVTFTNSGWTNVLIACNYSRGNLGGAPVYVSGAAGSQCPNGTDAVYTNLCRSF